MTSSEVPVRIPARAILGILDFLHSRDAIDPECGKAFCEMALALKEFSEHVDTRALAVMAEEHGELEIRPRG